MDDDYALSCDGAEPLDLASIDTRGAEDIAKDAGEERLDALSKELGELQELLFAAGTDALLIDSAGHGHLRQGRHDPDGSERHEPVRCPRLVVQGADR